MSKSAAVNFSSETSRESLSDISFRWVRLILLLVACWMIGKAAQDLWGWPGLMLATGLMAFVSYQVDRIRDALLGRDD